MDGLPTPTLTANSAQHAGQGGAAVGYYTHTQSPLRDTGPCSASTALMATGNRENRTGTGPHSCPTCRTQFVRLEHLKRHINSLHGNRDGQSHDCQFCGKSFLRRDILLRHFQSCRAAGATCDLSEPPRKRVKRACKTCSDLKLKCSGGPKCDRCAGLDQACVYPARRKRTLRQNQDHGGLQLERNPSAGEEDISIHPGPSQLQSTTTQTYTTLGGDAQGIERHRGQPHPDPNQLVTQVTDRQNAHGSENPARYPPRHWSASESAQMSGFGVVPIPDHLSEKGNDSQNGQQGVNLLAEDLTSKDMGMRKRGAYVSSACTNCQKRKIKCSGEQVCAGCRPGDLICAYKSDRKRRRKRAIPKATPEPINEIGPTTLESEHLPEISTSISSIVARIAKLERDNSVLKARAAISTDAVQIDSDSSSGYSSDYDENVHSESSWARSTFDDGFVHGATSLMEPIQVLNRTVAGMESEAGTSPESRHEARDANAAPTVTLQILPRGGNRTIKTLEKETRLYNKARLIVLVDVFFSSLNPHYPCLNEKQFRTQFERYLSPRSDDSASNSADRYQFIALINLICAEVIILSDESHDSPTVAGWDEFCRAEEILDRITWLGNGNLMTVQCLILKARYLLYIDKADAAYDTMGRIVRLCVRLGLHNQASWTSCTPFEIVMRQRIFWTVFYLERNLALTCGMPYLIREADFKVDLPMNLDDQLLSPTEPLPAETPERSYAPYLKFIVNWGKLSAEIWDAIFSVNAQKPTSQEFVASMDGRILYTIGQIPAHLQWQRNIHRLDTATDVPKYILRQTAILHLRMNRLRLLLRQDSLLSLNYGRDTATDCLKIASNSIDVVYTHLSSSVYGPTERWASVFNITGALLPLVSIIVKSDNEPQTRSDAIIAFEKGLAMLQQLAQNFNLACRTLQRLHRIIETTKQAIAWFQNIESGTMLFDPQQFETQTVVPQLSKFLNHDLGVSNSSDFLGQQFPGGVPYSLNDMSMHRNLTEVPGGMASFWVNDGYENQWMSHPTE